MVVSIFFQKVSVEARPGLTAGEEFWPSTPAGCSLLPQLTCYTPESQFPPLQNTRAALKAQALGSRTVLPSFFGEGWVAGWSRPEAPALDLGLSTCFFSHRCQAPRYLMVLHALAISGQELEVSL